MSKNESRHVPLAKEMNQDSLRYCYIALS